MNSYMRATQTYDSQDSLAHDFPGFLGKKGQNQHSKKANPQSKQKSDQNPRDHGDSYQTGQLNSYMNVESLGSRNINPGLEADGFFSPQDMIRKNTPGNDQNHGRPNQIEDSLDDVNQETARRRLSEISLKDLPMTKAGKFDGRSREVKDFLSLCVSADVDAYEYYNENLNKTPEPVAHRGPQKLNKGKDQASLRELQNFPLDSLKWSQNGSLDMRVKSCKEFVALCEDAGVDPMEYYSNNLPDEQEEEIQSIREQPKSPVHSEKSEKIHRPVYQPNDGLRRQETDQEAALRKLRDFPLNELHITKKNLLDMRRNNSKDFLMLCDNAGVDPMEYYFEHMGVPSNNMGNSSVSSINNSTRSVNLAESNLTLTKSSKLDKRFSSTKDFIKEKVAEAEMRLSQFDKSQLKRKKDGELDKRFKANKEYMDLQEQTQESYWENMKFTE